MSEAAPDDARVYSIAEERAARRAGEAAGGDRGADARPRCGALTAAGKPCRNYAVSGDRCRVHAARRTPARGQPPRRPAGLAGGTPPSVPRGVEPAAAGDELGARDGDGADGGTEGTRDRGPHRAADRSGSGGSGTHGSFAWAAQELERRGLGAAVDGLELLRDAADDRFLDALRGLVAFLRRRVTGEYEVDDFGFDEELTTHVLMPLLRPLHHHYWRVTSHGIEHVPTTGGGVLVANHAGTLPVDALITRLDVFDQTGRHARELGADLVFRTPLVGELARKTGATLASGDDADRLLAAGELVAVWPEGYKGLGKRWEDRYKLQRFGRGGFVATALRAQVPIVPTAIVGSEEIYPLLFDLRIVARLLGLPYFPVVAQMLALPVLGPFALLPLPSRWIIEYGERIETAGLGPDVAEDPMALFDLTDQVRERIQGMLHRNLMGRRSVFL